MNFTQAFETVKAMVEYNLSLPEGTPDDAFVVPYLVGEPGGGKTSILHAVGKALGIPVHVLSLADRDAGEVGGIDFPVEGEMRTVRMRPSWMPDEGPCILALDELPQAPTANQNLAARIANERKISEHTLPHGCIVVAAGNEAKHRAGTNYMPSHLRDRLTFIPVESDLDDVVRHFAERKFSPFVTGFLRSRAEFLHKFDRDANAYPSPRSWARVNALLTMADKFLRQPVDSIHMRQAIAGQIGEEAASAFVGYVKLYDKVPDLDALIANPDRATIDMDSGIMYHVVAGLSARMDSKNAANILKYVRRLPRRELAAYLVKDAVARDQSLKRSDAVREWALKEGRELIL